MAFWNGVVGLDRLLQRVPSIVEVWFVEFLAVMIFSPALGRLIDAYGFGACPPQPEMLDGFAWGSFAVGVLLMAWVVRRILRPRVTTVTWTPVFVARGTGGVSHVPVPMTGATVTYDVLSSHPSFALIHVLTFPLPLIALIGGLDGTCNMQFFRLFGVVGLVTLAGIAALRIVTWYVLRRGRAEIEASVPPGWTFARLEWEMAWRPVLATLGLIAACILIPAAIIWIRGY
jgi:hypothetical protein